jgi:hypothetical protein
MWNGTCQHAGAARARYELPTQTHAGVEELHLLAGVAGDYNYGPPGHTGVRIWSATGCTGVLITSTEDVLR